jgi:hypothetical protein
MNSKHTEIRKRWAQERTAARAARQRTDSEDEWHHLERCSDSAFGTAIDAKLSGSWSGWSWRLPAPGRGVTPLGTPAVPTSAR